VPNRLVASARFGRETSLGQRSQGGLTWSCIDSLTALSQAEQELREFLEREVDEPHVMHDPRIIAAFLERESGRSRPLLLALRREGRLVAVAPLFVQEGRFSFRISVWKIARLRARILKCFGDALPVARGSDPREAAAVVLEALAGLKERFDYLHLEEMTLPNPLFDAAAEGRAPGGFRAVPTYLREEKSHFHLLARSFEEYEQSVGSKKRSDMKRATRSYRDKDGSVLGRVERVSSAAEVAPFLEAVDAIFRKTWQARVNGYRPRNNEAERRFYDRLAELGLLRCYLLRDAALNAVAFVTGFQAFGTYLLEDVGHDLDAHDTNPGVALFYFMLQDVYRTQPPRMLDFGFGDNRYKAALATGARPARPIFLAGRGWHRLFMRAQLGLDALEEWARARIRGSALEVKLRAWLKRGTVKG